jgi:hypothetical protein
MVPVHKKWCSSQKKKFHYRSSQKKCKNFAAKEKMVKAAFQSIGTGILALQLVSLQTT